MNLEGVNLGELDRARLPEPIDILTLDLSYLSLTAAVPQLERVELRPGVQLIALVKPMFELGLPQPPAADADIARALTLAVRGIERAGWRVIATMSSPVTGARGAREHLLHAAKP